MTINQSSLLPIPESITAEELLALYANGFVTAFLRQDAVLRLVKTEADFLRGNTLTREGLRQRAMED